MPNRRGVIAAFASAALLAACQSLPTAPTSSTPMSSAPTPDSLEPAFSEIGLASWYGREFRGNRTADGERFDMNAMTAAHRTLPFNTYVRVTDLATDRSVVVRINDRGPYAGDRIIDLSAGAARALGITDDGVARVRIELVKVGKAKALDGGSPVWASDHP